MLFFLFTASISKVKLSDLDVLYYDDFSSDDVEQRWVPSDHPLFQGPWQVSETDPPQSEPGEKALIMRGRNIHHALSTKFKDPISNLNKTFILQYEMRPMFAFTCSGAYIKLFSQPNFDPKQLSNETEHTLMFGPDRCSSDNKVHFIFRHYNPVAQRSEEKFLKDPPKAPTDQLNHLYTLIVRPNNTFRVMIDNKIVRDGRLYFDFTPPVVPPQTVIVKGETYKNPEFYYDLNPHNFTPFTAIGFELWNTNRDIAFQRILLARNEEKLYEYNREDFEKRQRRQIKAYEDDTPSNPRISEARGHGFRAVMNGFIMTFIDGIKAIYVASPIATMSLIGVIALVFLMVFLLCCRKKHSKTE